MRQFLERDKIASRESFCRAQFENDWIVSWNKTEETNKRESFLKFIVRSGVLCTVERTAQASSSNCILQCYRKGNVCIVFTLIRFWTSRWFMQNNVERKVNEFAHVARQVEGFCISYFAAFRGVVCESLYQPPLFSVWTYANTTKYGNKNVRIGWDNFWNVTK